MPSAAAIAGVVVLYLPGSDLPDYICSYLPQVDRLYVVDNSEAPDPLLAEELRALPRVVLLQNLDNLGVARALNIGAEAALADGYGLLLTMDQDSRATPGMVVELLVCFHGQSLGQVGMVAPFHLTRAGHAQPTEVCRPVMTPMTSGCLLNLQAYRAVGPFRDNFFIDFVDNEYCLRLRAAGFEVLQAARAVLHHSVGDIRKFGPFIATNHSPLRRYYKTRNRFLVNRLYRHDFPGHCLFDRVRLVKEIGSIILFEKEKLAKLRMMWRGYQDYRRGKFGKYEG